MIFYASPNHLSALVTLAGYARETRDMPAIMPYSSGCQSIYQMPKLEGESENPRAILGMTDLTPRLFAERNKLTFAVPYKLYKTMEENAEESFLSASEWRNLLAAS